MATIVFMASSFDAKLSAIKYKTPESGFTSHRISAAQFKNVVNSSTADHSESDVVNNNVSNVIGVGVEIPNNENKPRKKIRQMQYGTTKDGRFHFAKYLPEFL